MHPEELRGDREVALEAVRESGDALQFVSEELLRDRELILEVLSGHNYSAPA